MVTEEPGEPVTINQFKHDTTSLNRRNVFEYLEIAATGENIKNVRKTPRQLSRNLSVISDDVFSSNLSLPTADSGLANDLSDSDDNFNNRESKGVGHSQFSFNPNPSNAPVTFHRSSRISPSQRKQLLPGSPVSNIEKEAAHRGLPTTSIFTTPNKSLLQTDAMFNSSDEEDDGVGSRLVSSFEIDKDPQSSMINDSVRSAIDSVLNDDDNEDSQTSWSSSAHRPPSSTSSSIHHNMFHSSSPAIPPSHDADLDAAVQSILNN
ncbi:unnamed protein product [Lymnaea stagnalis]|uniref:Uncharacterized protein n=1 Tax=Lymnaea stagnalis TaxID=6523 RepID=A0AAV2HT05_LYMST